MPRAAVPVAAAYDDSIGVVHRRLEKMFRSFAELSERGGIRIKVPFEDDVELLQLLLVLNTHPEEGAAETRDGVAHQDVVPEKFVGTRHQLALGQHQLALGRNIKRNELNYFKLFKIEAKTNHAGY
jgi:hypothetical protein